MLLRPLSFVSRLPRSLPGRTLAGAPPATRHTSPASSALVVPVSERLPLSTSGSRRLSSSLPPPSGGDEGFDFERESEETLESLCEQFEDLLGSAPGMEESDVSLSSGVLTVELPGRGIYVINRQSPNRQIWLSSPESGPARFDHQEGRWIYRRTGESLHELLDREVGEQVLKTDSNFQDCYLGGRKKNGMS